MAAATDIVVRRCNVRVVRQGGWSWGPQPQRLVDQVLAALPGLLATQLAGLAPDGAADVEIIEPVQIVVSLTLADLLAGRFDPHQHAAIATEPLPGTSASNLAQPQALIRPHRTRFLARTPPLPARIPPMTLARFLGLLFERGELSHFLALLPVDTLAIWYQSLTAPRGAATQAGSAALPAMPAGRLESGITRLTTATPALSSRVAATPETGRSQQLRDAISAIAARASRAAAADPLQPGDPAAGFHDRRPSSDPALVDPHAGTALAAATTAGTVPAGTAAATTAGAIPPDTAAAAGPTPPAHATTPPGGAATPTSATTAGTSPATTAATTGPTPPPHAATTPAHIASPAMPATVAEVASALPFLLLSPLAQIGYFSALTPALEPTGLQAQTAVFATALAYTVLRPLECGWRRQPGDAAAAAAFAGLGAPMPGSALTEFARAASPGLPALDAVVTRALAEGHTAGEPLLLAGADGGLLLLDREGLFPVAWADTVAGLLPAWRMCASPPVLVAPTAMDALGGLAAADVTFVVPSPPGRNERWRRLPPYRLWTNDRAGPELAQYAAGYQQATDLAAGLIQALATERTAVPLAASPALGRSLLLAAGLGLGTLAWTLWREREPTDPLLALERFADLSARVSFEPHRVRVRLPLGPRHSDLSAHGLLIDVPGVPWFGGRVVEFSGG